MASQDFQKYFLVFFLAFLNSCAISGMQESLQERLNNEAPETIPGNLNRSQYRLQMPLKNLPLIQEQVRSFNERMKKDKIHVTFSQDEHYNTLFKFFAQLPYSEQTIEIHQVFMPYGESENLSDHVTRTQLKRRFEHALEDKVEKISSSIETTALNKYKNSYKREFYFTIAPTVMNKLSNKIAADIAGAIVQLLPFSFQDSLTPPVINIKEAKSLAKKVKVAQKQLAEAQQLAQEIEQFHEQLQTMPEEKNKEKEQLKKSVNEQFCHHFEKQIAA